MADVTTDNRVAGDDDVEPPMVLFDRSGWPTFFDSVPELLAWVEPIDIEDREYRVFDSEGLELTLILEEMPANRVWRRSSTRVRLVRADEARKAPGALRALLLAAGQRIDAKGLSELSLGDLIGSVRRLT